MTKLATDNTDEIKVIGHQSPALDASCDPDNPDHTAILPCQVSGNSLMNHVGLLGYLGNPPVIKILSFDPHPLSDPHCCQSWPHSVALPCTASS